MADLPRPVTMMMFGMPECSASSTPYWMIGLSTTGNISFGSDLVAGRNRVPSPAAGKTAFRTLAGIFYSLVPQRRSWQDPVCLGYLVCAINRELGKLSDGLCNSRTLHWHQRYGLRRRLPGGLHPPQER